MARPIALLDRDGTLVDFVRDPELGVVTPAFHPAQLRLMPGVVEGLQRLTRAGFGLAIATNQPDAAKGRVPREAIARTNAALVDRLAAEGVHIEAVACCLHHPEGGEGGDAELIHLCDCRKPAPGLLTGLLHQLDGDASRSWMIGDTAADLGAGRAAGVSVGLVMTPGRCELCPLRGAEGSPEVSGAHFEAVAQAIVARSPGG